jgi:hypothetical protein
MIKKGDIFRFGVILLKGGQPLSAKAAGRS